MKQTDKLVKCTDTELNEIKSAAGCPDQEFCSRYRLPISFHHDRSIPILIIQALQKVDKSDPLLAATFNPLYAKCIFNYCQTL